MILRTAAATAILLSSTSLATCSANSPDPSQDGVGDADGAESPEVTGAQTYVGEAWADNWFSMSIGDELIVEDSVPITTERSFNAETFTFTATPPFVMAFVLKDYKENDTGLEYIGEPNQQMGDGGFITQIRSKASGELVAVSDADWRCLVIHTAPLDTSCETSSTPETECLFEAQDEPAGWHEPDFDDSAWTPATVHSAGDVRPKDGYDEIEWDASAQLVWGTDLERDNTILCRAKVD